MAINDLRTRQLDMGLAILRVAIGAVFVAHGAQKLFVSGIGGVQAGFGQMGIPFAEFVAPAVSLLEFAGGIALIAGLFTRVVAIGLALNALGALLFVHLPNGFFLPGGYEFVMALFGASAALALAGGGRWSLDALLNRKRQEARHGHGELQRA